MTACGSTTSSQGTRKTTEEKVEPKPLEEAPFKIYLKILREEGYGEQADNIEKQCRAVFEELGYTEDDLYGLEFKKVQQVITIYATELNRQVMGNMQPLSSMGGNLLLGEGAEKLNPEALQQLAMRQMQLHEENKQRQYGGA